MRTGSGQISAGKTVRVTAFDGTVKFNVDVDEVDTASLTNSLRSAAIVENSDPESRADFQTLL